MLRILLAAAALLSAPLSAFVGSGGNETHEHSAMTIDGPPDRRHTLVLDASAMPGETGWLLIPIRAQSATYVEGETRLRHVQPASGAAGSAIIADIGEQSFAFGNAREAYRDLEVNARGEHVECCQDLLVEPLQYGARSSSASGFGGYLEEGEVGWVGLAAVGWLTGSKMKITLTSDAPLVAGAPHTGPHVEAIDLVAAAREAGDNVRLGSNLLVGAPGEARLAWPPSVTGLLVAQYYAQGDAHASLSIARPDGARLVTDVEDVYGDLFALGADAVDVALTGLKESDPQLVYTAGSPPPGWVRAVVLYAQLDVPLEGGMAHESPIVDEDW